MVDGTLGEGGHAEAFLSRFPGLRLVGVDADKEIQARARERLAPFGDRVRFENALFEEFLAGMAGKGEGADIVLLDLGISIFHYELSGRGFSFGKDESLDMRIDPTRGESAADIVQTRPENELADLIFNFGEERYSRRIARLIVQERGRGRIGTAKALAELVYRAVPAQARHGRSHPATKTFQALRIAANDELGRLERGMAAAARALKPGGRLGVISFHSLEDRIVKRYFKALVSPMSESGETAAYEAVTRKPVEASDEEARSNPPSRSAKLRVVGRRG
jgi:16S rRNA (cytosine1402-N4)-methyltransferase